MFPHELPVWKSRAEKFDHLVLTAFAPIDARWHKRLTKLDIAVDEVPKIRARDPDTVNWPDEVVADGPVPLSRLVPAGIDRRGAATRARIVTGTWVMVQPARAAITSDSTVSPRYSAG